MRLTAILTVVVLTISATLVRADDSDGPKKVLFVVSSAGSMSTVFGALKNSLKKSVDGLAATDQVGVMFFTDGEPKKSSDHLVNADAAAKKKITAMIDAAKASGKSDPVPAVKAALAMKPDILYLLLDQVPDGDALVKAVKAGDPDKVTRISVLFFVTDVDDEDPKQTATVEALSQAVKFSGGQFRKILKADTANVAPAGPVVFALSNSGSMLAVIGHERLDIAKAVGELPVGTKFDVIVFADGKSTAMTDAPAASDGKSKGATDDFLIANPAGATANPSPA